MVTAYRITKIGRIGISEENDFITNLYLPDGSANTAENGDSPLIREAFRRLEQYFNGSLKEFSLPLKPKGTAFMRKVWKALCTVPYGETASYKDIAAMINNPKAARAVGQANNRNPIPIFIPCHRIIGSSGNLTGYSGGLAVKKQLLDLERDFMCKPPLAVDRSDLLALGIEDIPSVDCVLDMLTELVKSNELENSKGVLCERAKEIVRMAI